MNLPPKSFPSAQAAYSWLSQNGWCVPDNGQIEFRLAQHRAEIRTTREGFTIHIWSVAPDEDQRFCTRDEAEDVLEKDGWVRRSQFSSIFQKGEDRAMACSIRAPGRRVILGYRLKFWRKKDLVFSHIKVDEFFRICSENFPGKVSEILQKTSETEARGYFDSENYTVGSNARIVRSEPWPPPAHREFFSSATTASTTAEHRDRPVNLHGPDGLNLKLTRREACEIIQKLASAISLLPEAAILKEPKP